MVYRIRVFLVLWLAIALPTIAASRLSHTVEPAFEAIELTIDPSKESYSGTARFELRAREPVTEFSLHSRDIEIQRVELRSKDSVLPARSASRDQGLLAILPDTPLAAGDYTLTLDFTQEFDTQASALYRAEHEGHAFAFTDFQPIAARRAFPCFDEPDFKIPFQLTVRIPKDLQALTNTPIESERVDGASKTVVFRRTPPLPTYLLALAVGPFESVPIPGTSAPARVVTVPGKLAFAKDAVQLTPPVLSALERYFGRKYPFEKLDLLALPEFPGGAMENPGAITFTDSLLLLDSTSSGPAERKELLGFVTHELAHMWFGDLVTMEWWDDLWLNEAFAEWLGNKIVHEVQPELRSELDALRWIQSTMSMDSRPSSPPIRRTIDDPETVFQEYDLTYAKGMAVLGMFEQWMGPEAFRQGVLDYLAAHEWKNARAADLWDALGRSAKRDVGAAMGTFLDQGGLPLVSVEPLPDGTLRVRQKRFLKAGVEAPAQTWKIPVVLRSFDGTALHSTPILLETAELLVPAPARPPVWVLPDAGAWGYYRWSVPGPMLEALAKDAPKRLSLRERVAFLGNLAALLESGSLHGDQYLRLQAYFAQDSAPEVLRAVLDGLYVAHDPFVTAEIEEHYARFLRQVLGPVLERFGSAPVLGEAPAITMLRPQLWDTLADPGRDEKWLARAEELARSADLASVDASLIDAIVRLSAIRGDKARFDEYRRRFETSTIPAERARYLSALGRFRDPALQDQALAYALDGPLKSNEVMRIPNLQRSEEANRDRVLGWMMKNYAALAKRIPPDYVVELPALARGCSTARLDSVVKFFSEPANKVAGTEAALVKLEERVRDCVTLREREGRAVAEFLRSP